MESRFDVRVLQYSVVSEFADAWSAPAIAALLDALSFGDTAGLSADDLREMCFMSLQDLDPDKAAERVLEQRIGERLQHGKIEHIAEEMVRGEKLWEEYPQIELHEALFHAASLLYAAMPRIFARPDAVALQLEVQARDPEGAAELAQPLSDPFLVRLLAEGMSDRALLHRLFDTQLAGTSFPEAGAIVWTAASEPVEGGVRIALTSSVYWLGPLSEVRGWESSAHPDLPADDED